ncbi:MAG: histidine kinase [Phycisphaerales bacterium]|nr:histidine kinase [Phycisphaerales bacterium]
MDWVLGDCEYCHVDMNGASNQDREPTSAPLHRDVAAIARISVVQKILEVICRTTGLGFSAIARVTDGQWIACAVRDEISFGLEPGGELELQTTLCHEVRCSGDVIAIDHVETDQKFADHQTPRMYGFQSYISVPIRLPDGTFFGTLCAIDPKPAIVNTPDVIGMFTLFADLIAQHLDGQTRLTASETALAVERETAQFREQFMAVLGHDLRNPLAAIRSGADILALDPLDGETADVVSIIQRSASRMTSLIENVLDFARGRLGGGLSAHLKPSPKLSGHLQQVVTELQTSWPAREINYEWRNDDQPAPPVSCDMGRVGQLLSNLLANALTHGDPASPVWVRAGCRSNGFELCVTNHGPTIPPTVQEHLFRPFARGTARPGQEGLGLGLYIATEIARAHDGSLTVQSTAGETCFTFRMGPTET